jgi:hypothetical protein
MAYGTVNADLMTTSDGVSSSGLYGFKNRIINGAMVIDQRNAGASITPTNTQYSVDRWQGMLNAASKFTLQQTPSATETGYATRVGAGFTNYLACTSSSAYTVGAAETYSIRQNIEGFNFADMAWGTASAKTVTLSFWAYSSLTGTFGGALQNSAYTRSYPFSFTISSANTWTQISVTIAGDTTGTWIGATNGVGVRVIFSLGSGSTLSGTAGAWAATEYWSATGATSVVGTNGATFYITGVQLEKGSTATSFDYRPYGTELQLCQRYYWQMNGSSNVISTGFMRSTTVCLGVVQFPVTMRTTASLNINSGTAYFHFSPGGGDLDATTLAIAGGGTLISQNQANIQATASSGTSTTGFGAVININNASAYVGFSAEL